MGATLQVSEKSHSSEVLLLYPGHGMGLERTTLGPCLDQGLPGPSGSGRQTHELVFWNDVQSRRAAVRPFEVQPWCSPAQGFCATTIHHCPPRQQAPELGLDLAIWPEAAGSHLPLSPEATPHPSPPGCWCPGRDRMQIRRQATPREPALARWTSSL